MVYGLPTHGEANWDTKVSASITAVKATADAAAPSLGATVEYLNVYDNFFGGYGWVAGQLSTATTTTASVSPGATVLPLTSVAGISANVLLTDGTTVYRTVSVAANNVTVTPTVVGALSNGATVAPLFANVNHLYDTQGWAAWAKWVVGRLAQDPGSGKVVFLMDSWGAQGVTQLTAALAARYPSATAVCPTGNSGFTSLQLLAAFGAQVPSDAFYVVTNEPGVNDTIGSFTPADTAGALERFAAACRAIGARFVYTGAVPMENYPGRAKELQRTTGGQFSDPRYFPYVQGSAVHSDVAVRKVNDASFGIGDNSLVQLTTGEGNLGLGYSTLYSLTTGAGNVAVGTSAGQNVVDGHDNVLLGLYAGFAPGGFSANAITSGFSNVFIGSQAGYPNTTQVLGAVAIGYNALAGGGSCAGAIGYATRAADYGAWAIGTDSTGTGASSSTQDQMVLGTSLHTVRIPGYLRLDRGQTTVGAAGGASALPATPTKYLSVKDSAGTEYVFPVYAKA